MSRRSNQEWLEALRGERGVAQLELSHKDLANYLYIVAFNYLLRRQAQANPFILSTFTSRRLEGLAEEFAQDTLEKMMAHKLALLDKFEGSGAFTSWMAVVATRLIADDLRLAKWKWEVEPPSDNRRAQDDDEQERSSFFERIAGDLGVIEEQELSVSLQNCLHKLSKNRRQAILARVVEERTVQEVADEMGKSKNAVYLLVNQAKGDLRNCLKDSN